MQLKIINDLDNHDFNIYLEMILNEALNDQNPNSQNLSHLKTKKYLVRHIVLDEVKNNPMAVAAIEDYTRDNIKCGRVLTRSYYMKSYRNNRFERKIVSGDIVRNLLPIQVEFLKKYSYDLIFVSMETLQKRNVLQSWINAVNEWYPKWTLLDGFYYTCRKSPPEIDIRCWQNIALMNLSEFEFPLNFMSHQEYLERFKNVKQ